MNRCHFARFKLISFYVVNIFSGLHDDCPELISAVGYDQFDFVVDGA